jgi:hypothetical protein
MKPTHKVTIGNEVFLANLYNDGYTLLHKCGLSCELSKAKLDFLNAKIEEIRPFVFEADVFWERGNAVHPVMDSITKCNHKDGFACLIGKHGRLIFTEEV